MGGIKVSELPEQMSGYSFSTNTPRYSGIPGTYPQQVLNTRMRCPLPPLASNPDSLRNFYLNNNVLQARILPPSLNMGSAGGSSTVVSFSETTGGTSSNPVIDVDLPPTAVTTAVTTNLLAAGQKQMLTVLLAKSFLLLVVKSTTQSRVQLYATNAAQVSDFSRTPQQPLPPNTTDGIISDVVLGVPISAWNYVNTTGLNSDVPQTNIIYISITNFSNATTAVIVTLSYIPLES